MAVALELFEIELGRMANDCGPSPGTEDPIESGLLPATLSELLVFCPLFLLPCLDLDPEPVLLEIPATLPPDYASRPL